jgi:hypothetical protein
MERFFIRLPKGDICECNEEDWNFQSSPYQLARSFTGSDGDIVLEFINPATRLISTELLALIALVWEEGTQEKEQIPSDTETVTCAPPESSES